MESRKETVFACLLPLRDTASFVAELGYIAADVVVHSLKIGLRVCDCMRWMTSQRAKR